MGTQSKAGSSGEIDIMKIRKQALNWKAIYFAFWNRLIRTAIFIFFLSTFFIVIFVYEIMVFTYCSALIHV